MVNMYRTYIIKQVSQEIQPSVQLPTVLMPDGKYWTSVDLNINDGQGGVSIAHNVTVNGYNFGTQYYYTHEAAMRIASNLQGYHLPTREEVSTLMNRIGGDSYDISLKLRNTYGWDDEQGTDDYGFSVLPIGNKYYASDRIEWTGSSTHYWLYDDRIVVDEYTRFNNLSIGYNGINNEGDEIGAFGYKVRLIKDYVNPIKYRPLSIWTPDPPTPSVEYDYVIKLWTNTSYFYLTALCLDRNQEGVGNYYSDAECTNELTELGNWNAFNNPTIIFTEEDPNDPEYRIATIYAKNLNISNDGYGTIINASISNWNWGYVYDKYGNIISSQIPQSTEQYTNIYYN